MTDRYVALLRGVNLGQARRVVMADLKQLLEGLGYRDVRTLLNSGNAVFTGRGAARTHEQRIEEALLAELGIASRVIVLGAADVAAILAENPLEAVASDPSRLFVAVPAAPGDLARLQPAAKQEWGPDVLALGPRAAYFWCPGGMSQSAIPDAVARALGDRVTTRNRATMGRIAAALASTSQAKR